MKATGIVRRIDDLGRIVIPRELRREMGLVENSPVEFFTTKGDNGTEIVIVKYSPEEKPQPQEEEKTFIFTVEVDSETVGTIKVDKKQNELLDWLFDNDCLRNDVNFKDGYPELVDFTK